MQCLQCCIFKLVVHITGSVKRLIDLLPSYKRECYDTKSDCGVVHQHDAVYNNLAYLTNIICLHINWLHFWKLFLNNLIEALKRNAN